MGKEKDGKWDPELKKAYDEERREFKAELKKLSKLDFKQFQKGIVELVGLFNEALIDTVELSSGQTDMLVDAMAERFKGVNKDLTTLDERLSRIEHFSFVMAVKLLMHTEEKPLTYEQKSNLSSLLGYSWDKTIEDLDLVDLMWVTQEKAPKTETSQKDS